MLSTTIDIVAERSVAKYRHPLHLSIGASQTQSADGNVMRQITAIMNVWKFCDVVVPLSGISTGAAPASGKKW
jgi:hypothetical protein